MKEKTYLYKGTKLVPLTLDVACTLDKGDIVKYIGPKPDNRIYSTSYYGKWTRGVYTIQSKPCIKSNHIVLKNRNGNYSILNCEIAHLALAERGNTYDVDARRAAKFIPINLKSFKKNLSYSIQDIQKKIDKYLEKLPLHKKLELFKNLSAEDKIIYECLYKDIEVLIGLKEETEQSNGN
jgi:hypothetical protein